jgi:hypothetical protein
MSGQAAAKSREEVRSTIKKIECNNSSKGNGMPATGMGGKIKPNLSGK